MLMLRKNPHAILIAQNTYTPTQKKNEYKTGNTAIPLQPTT